MFREFIIWLILKTLTMLGYVVVVSRTVMKIIYFPFFKIRRIIEGDNEK